MFDKMKNDIGIIKNKIEKIATGVQGLGDELLHPVPKEYQELHERIGGTLTVARDGVAMLEHALTPSLRGAHGHTEVFLAIQHQHEELMRSASIEAYANPIERFNSLFNQLNEDSQTLIVAFLDAMAPDWRKLPNILQDCQKVIAEKTAHPQGKDSPLLERSGGVIVYLIILRALSSSISAVGQFFPLSVGIGVLGGASVGIVGEVKLDSKILQLGAVVLLLKVCCDTAYEAVSQVTAA